MPVELRRQRVVRFPDATARGSNENLAIVSYALGGNRNGGRATRVNRAGGRTRRLRSDERVGGDAVGTNLLPPGRGRCGSTTRGIRRLHRCDLVNDVSCICSGTRRG